MSSRNHSRTHSSQKNFYPNSNSRAPKSTENGARVSIKNKRNSLGSDYNQDSHFDYYGVQKNIPTESKSRARQIQKIDYEMEEENSNLPKLTIQDQPNDP